MYVSGWFQDTVVEMSSCDRDHMAGSPKIFISSSSRKRLLTLALECFLGLGIEGWFLFSSATLGP